MAHAEDRYHLADDPALADFKKAYDAAATQMRRQDFTDLLLAGVGTYEPQRWSIYTGMDAFNQDPLWQERLWLAGPEPFLYWRSEDHRSRPPTFEEARPKVEAAWRRIRARDRARTRANEIQQVIAEKYKESPAEAVKYLRDQKVGRVFELSGVSRLVEPFGAVDSRNTTYVGYTFPVSDIRYPKPNLVDQLMSLDKGESVVESDRPREHFYVAVVVERSVPSQATFLAVYSRSPIGDPLWTQNALANIRQTYDQDVIREMRATASGKVDKDGRFEIPGNVLKNISGTAESEE
jgi:hypothetical protein